MRPRDGLADLEDPIEIAATWGDLFFSGQIRELDWLTMRTCTVDLSGTASDAEPLDRQGVCDYAHALSEAFDDVAWRVGQIEQREHEVRFDASLEARHTGPLDLSFRDGPTYAATGRRLRLPFQRFAWTIAHKRVLAFEIEQGPGLGMDFLVRELELDRPTVAAEKRPKEEPSKAHAVEAQPPDLGPAEASDGSEDPWIEELIERAKAADTDQPAGA